MSGPTYTSWPILWPIEVSIKPGQAHTTINCWGLRLCAELGRAVKTSAKERQRTGRSLRFETRMVHTRCVKGRGLPGGVGFGLAPGEEAVEAVFADGAGIDAEHRSHLQVVDPQAIVVEGGEVALQHAVDPQLREAIVGATRR